MLNSLLRSQNHCLIEIQNATQAFLDRFSNQTEAFTDEFAYHSNQLYQKRQKWLSHIERLQSQMPDTIHFSDNELFLEIAHDQIRSQMGLIIEQIKSLDQKVEKLIEKNQGIIEKTLLSARKNRQILGKFKSHQTGQSGNELDRTL